MEVQSIKLKRTKHRHLVGGPTRKVVEHLFLPLLESIRIQLKRMHGRRRVVFDMFKMAPHLTVVYTIRTIRIPLLNNGNTPTWRLHHHIISATVLQIAKIINVTTTEIRDGEDQRMAQLVLLELVDTSTSYQIMRNVNFTHTAPGATTIPITATTKISFSNSTKPHFKHTTNGVLLILPLYQRNQILQRIIAAVLEIVIVLCLFCRFLFFMEAGNLLE